MIPRDLSTKYGLSEDEAALAVEEAIAKVLASAFDKDIRVRVDDPLEILALGRDPFAAPRRIDLTSISRQLQRQVRYQIERELEKRQILREWERLRSLRGHLVVGEIGRYLSNGDLSVVLEVEDHFRGLILTGRCPVRHLPPHERGRLSLGQRKAFLVTSVLPVWERNRAKVLIRLSRTSKALPEVLLRQAAGEPSLRCRRRIAGAFSQIETIRRLPREAIREVGQELGERIIVRVVAP